MIELVYKYKLVDSQGRLIEKVYPRRLDKIDPNYTCLSFRRDLVFRKKLRPKDLSKIANKIYLLLGANMELIDCLEHLGQNEKNPAKKLSYLRIKDRLARGGTLAKSLDEEAIFPATFIKIVGVFEEAGRLEQAFYEIDAYYGEQALVRDRLISISLYPLIILSLLALSGVVFGKFVIPSFIDLYQDLDAQLPPLSLKIISLGSFLYRRVYIIILLILGLALGLTKLLSQDKFRLAWDRFKLEKFRFIKYSYGLDMSKLIGMLLDANLQFYQALELYMDRLDNQYLRQVLAKCLEEIGRGRDFTSYLGTSGALPPIMVELISQGYISGSLVQALNDSHSICQEEFKNMLDRGLELVEPIILLLIGFFILLVALTILLPMTSIIDVIK